MEGDLSIGCVRGIYTPDVWNEVQSLLVKHEDALRAVVGGRYDWVRRQQGLPSTILTGAGAYNRPDKTHILHPPFWVSRFSWGLLAIIFLLTYQGRFPLSKRFLDRTSAFGKWIDASLNKRAWWVRGILVKRRYWWSGLGADVHANSRYFFLFDDIS